MFSQYMAKPLILAPVGSIESLMAAINAGADAVYFGVGSLHMRTLATGLTVQQLPQIVKTCHTHSVKAYVTVNSIMYDSDLKKLKPLLEKIQKSGADAIIATDIAVILEARKQGIPVHISTQQNISNLEAVKYFSQFADCVVLARELPLKSIEYICSEIQKQNILGPSGEHVKVEIFVHGALCVGISGKCYMSLASYNKSANRGECYQVCRRKYTVIDDETQNKLTLDNQYVMSPSDLCTLPILDKIIATSVRYLKIEGRAKSPEYVSAVVQAYKTAIDHIMKKSYTIEIIQKLESDVSKVYNRGFWKGGYYLGLPVGEWSGSYGSQATEKKEFVGEIINYYSQKKIAYVSVLSNEFTINDELYIIGNTTGVVREKVTQIQDEQTQVKNAQKKTHVTIPMNHKVRKGDKVYVIIQNQ